jgi:1-acyl-sn-glycerol-3-phosphate acyltransferase
MKGFRVLLRLTGFFLLVLGGLLTAALLFHRKNRGYQHHRDIVRRWLGYCASILGCKIVVQNGSGSSPPNGSLLVSNHISWLDIFVLGSVYQLRFLSKAEIRNWPLFGWLSASSGTLFIQRGSGSDQAAQLVSRALLAGDNVLLFPESTTTSGITVKPFHPRLFKSAFETTSPVVPLLISYPEQRKPDTRVAWDDVNSFWNTVWHILSRQKTRVIIQQFDPFYPNAETSRTVLAKKCHSQIRNALEQLYD